MGNNIHTVYLTLFIISGCIKVTDQPHDVKFVAKYASTHVKSSYSTFTENNSAIIYAYAVGSTTINIPGTPLNAVLSKWRKS